jgi:hypothetical protein
VQHASTPDEVMGRPGPVTVPCVASKGKSQTRTSCDSFVKASRFPSGERENSVSCPGPVVTRSIEIARKVLGIDRHAPDVSRAAKSPFEVNCSSGGRPGELEI